MKFSKFSLKRSKSSTTKGEVKRENIPELNEHTIRKAFEQCSDVNFSKLNFQNNSVTLVYCSGLINNDMLYKTIPLRLGEFFQYHSVDSLAKLDEHLQLPSLKQIKRMELIEKEIFLGKLLLIFVPGDLIYSVDISNTPQRKPEETSMEVSFKGPRDNFIESVIINQALIRKRLPTRQLVSEFFEIGERTKTKVSLLYMKDIIDLSIIDEIRSRISEIDIDGLYSGTQLGELISNSPYSIFPRYTYTGRPDFAVQTLLNGRFIILIDGVSSAFIAPVNLFFLLKTAEDNETPFLYNSFERLIRVTGIFLAVFLPGFWVALTTFHQNQVPFTLLATVIESRKGVPLPTSLEALIMLALFEVFREAGMRLPLAIGQTLSVIGGLIIGDAAIRAGLTSPAMLVVIAGSTISTFTLVNQSLVGLVSLIRFIIIIVVSVLGFFGFFLSIFVLLIVLGRIESFGIPYLHIALRISIKNVIKAIFKVPEPLNNKRPRAVNPQDTNKQGGSS